MDSVALACHLVDYYNTRNTVKTSEPNVQWRHKEEGDQEQYSNILYEMTSHPGGSTHIKSYGATDADIWYQATSHEALEYNT